jgi:hypothetical protein
MDIIKQLKENEKPFGLMSKEMQEKLSTLVDSLQYYSGSGIWQPYTSKAGFEINGTYRLRPDYEEEPEVIRVEITSCIVNGLLYDLNGRGMLNISEAQNNPDFIGFLYEDGNIIPMARKYTGEGAVKMITGMGQDTKVLTPTHVLFRGKA